MQKDSFVISPVNMAERQKTNVRSGDTVKVWVKIQEKGKTRLQLFEGLVLAVKHGKEAGGTFTVRRVASGVGVEKIFPLYSPIIDKITVVKHADLRRSKLYHVRKQAAKEIKRQMRHTRMVVEEETETETVSEEAPVAVE
jgi:large subunit ribosomal protein L19